MSTDELIRALAADLDSATGHDPGALVKRLALATAASSLIVCLLIVTILSPSPHLFAAPAPELPIMFIVAAAATLAAAAFRAAAKSLRPETEARPLRLLAIPGLLMLIGIAAELTVLPASTWPARLIGSNPIACFAIVALLALPILAAALMALRLGAPSNPAATGAVAGLLAGALTMGLYVLHCPEDSLLFVAAWHVPAVLLTSAIGALSGARLLRW
jgi:hypothetical protein